MAIDFYNETTLEIDIGLAEAILASLSTKDIELLIVDTPTIQTLNLEHRHIDKPTDVLSFPLEAGEYFPLGSIVICDAFITHGAMEFGHTAQDEFALLFIHGLLHLLGFDHEKDNGEMRAKEESIILQHQLPLSLIVRTEG